MKSKFTAREADVPVPDLARWFDGEAVWRVRGLTGEELGRVNNAARRNATVAGILDGLLAGADKESVAQSIRALMGHDGSVPEDIARRLEQLTIGSVDPVCDIQLAVKLCKTFPIEFYTITNKIVQLTGQGAVPGESKGSGGTEPSEPA